MNMRILNGHGGYGHLRMMRDVFPMERGRLARKKNHEAGGTPALHFSGIRFSQRPFGAEKDEHAYIQLFRGGEAAGNFF
jgi:hypothetical protein